MKKFKGFIETAFKETNERYDILEEYTLPEDFKTIPAFKEGNYLKVVFLRKNRMIIYSVERGKRKPSSIALIRDKIIFIS